MKKDFSILDIIDPLGESDTDDRDVYQLRGKRVMSKTIDLSDIATYRLPKAAKEVVSASGFYTFDDETFFTIQIESVSSLHGITITTEIPPNARGFISVSFTRKAKDNPMAKYIVAGLFGVVIMGLLMYSPEIVQLAMK